MTRRVLTAQTEFRRRVERGTLDFTSSERGHLVAVVGVVDYSTTNPQTRPLEEAPRAEVYKVTLNDAVIGEDEPGCQLDSRTPLTFAGKVFACELQVGDRLTLFFELGGQDVWNRVIACFCYEIPNSVPSATPTADNKV